MIKREQHYFSFNAGKNAAQKFDDVRRKLISMNAVITIFDPHNDTGECRIGFTVRPDDCVKVFLYIDTLEDYRIYM